jgi:hypothetical protein
MRAKKLKAVRQATAAAIATQSVCHNAKGVPARHYKRKELSCHHSTMC